MVLLLFFHEILSFLFFSFLFFSFLFFSFLFFSFFVNIKRLLFLNFLYELLIFSESPTHRVAAIFNITDADFLQSDVGQPLLIHMPFTQHVKIASLQLKALDNGEAKESLLLTVIDSCPKDIKLFVDKPSMSLDDAECTKPTQILSVDASQ